MVCFVGETDLSFVSKKNNVIQHYKAIIKLGVPIAVGQLGVIILGFADTMMVGKYSTDALAAASFVNNLFTLITFVLMGYSYGLTPIVGECFGRGNLKEAGGVLKHALVANTLFSAIVLMLMTLLYFCIESLGQPTHLLPLIRPYYLVILFSMVFVMLFNVLRQFTDGTTDTLTGMYCLLAGNVFNIVGNWFLIYGIGPFPELGLLGAGFATLASRVLMVVMLVAFIAFRKRYAICRIGFSNTPLCKTEVLKINRSSLPVSIQMGLESGAFTMSAVMAGWIGAIELAAYQVMVTIGTLGFLFYYSFGAGMSIRIATFFGVGDWNQVKLSAKAGCHVLIAMALLSSAVMFFFAQPLVTFFTDDVAVINLSLSLIVPLLIYQMGDAMQICYANALRGTSHVLSMMWVAFVSYLLVNIPLAYLLGFVFAGGIYGIFLAFSAGLFTAAFLFYWNFRRVLRALPA